MLSAVSTDKSPSKMPLSKKLLIVKKLITVTNNLSNFNKNSQAKLELLQ